VFETRQAEPAAACLPSIGHPLAEFYWCANLADVDGMVSHVLAGKPRR